MYVHYARMYALYVMYVRYVRMLQYASMKVMLCTYDALCFLCMYVTRVLSVCILCVYVCVRMNDMYVSVCMLCTYDFRVNA